MIEIILGENLSDKFLINISDLSNAVEYLRSKLSKVKTDILILKLQYFLYFAVLFQLLYL